MIITFEQVTKMFGADLILNAVSGQIEEGQRIGLIGPNGAGKSTLLQILNNDLEFDNGTVDIGRGKTFGFLRQDSGLNVQHTIAQEMRSVFTELLQAEAQMRSIELELADCAAGSREYEGLSEQYTNLQSLFEAGEGYQIAAKINTVLNGMGFAGRSQETPINVLSGGEKTRLALCKLLLEEPDLLILDEPTNHLDFSTLNWLEDYLLSYKGAILTVSHDRYFLNRLCNYIWHLEHHILTSYKGNYSRYLVLKEEQEAFYQKEYNAQQEEIAKQKDFIARNMVRASTTKRAQSRQKMLDKMEVMEAPKYAAKPPKLAFAVSREPVSDILMVEDFGITLADTDKTLFRNIAFHLKRGEKVALVGQNGIGKSTMLKALMGNIPYEGLVVWGRNTEPAYFDQGEGDLDPQNTVLQELWNDFPRETELTIRSILGHAGLRGAEVFKRVSSLSGGERARLKFAKLMLQKGNVLLLDEPTNHLDLPSKEALDTALVEYAGTLFVVSHDRYLLSKFPDKIMELTSDGLRVYNGNYEDYQREQQKQQPATQELPVTQAKPLKAAAPRGKEQRKLAAQRRQQLAHVEERIASLEQEQSTLQQLLATPEVQADYQKLQETYERMEQIGTELEALLEEWGNLVEMEDKL